MWPWNKNQVQPAQAKAEIWLLRDSNFMWHKVVAFAKPKGQFDHLVMGPFPTERHAEELANRLNEASKALGSIKPYEIDREREEAIHNWRSIDDE